MMCCAPIAMIMTLAANAGYCSTVFASIIMVLLPKAMGGWRRLVFTSLLHVSTFGGVGERSRRAGNGRFQALLGMPVSFLEAQLGRWVRYFGGHVVRLGAHRPRQGVWAHSVLPLVEGGCETRLPTAALASPDWRVRLAAVSAGGHSGGASRCTGEALPCWLLDATTVMERACNG